MTISHFTSEGQPKIFNSIRRFKNFKKYVRSEEKLRSTGTY